MKCSTCGLDAEANLCPDICHAEYVSTELILLSKELLEQNREIRKLTTERDALMEVARALCRAAVVTYDPNGRAAIVCPSGFVDVVRLAIDATHGAEAKP